MSIISDISWRRELWSQLIIIVARIAISNQYFKYLNKTAVACKLSEWTEWGECSQTCGQGQQKRIREMKAACPDLETTECERTKCPPGRWPLLIWLFDFHIFAGERFPNDPLTPLPSLCPRTALVKPLQIKPSKMGVAYIYIGFSVYNKPRDQEWY